MYAIEEEIKYIWEITSLMNHDEKLVFEKKDLQFLEHFILGNLNSHMVS